MTTTARFGTRASPIGAADAVAGLIGFSGSPSSVTCDAGANRMTPMAGSSVGMALIVAVESTQPAVANPGLGATVSAPPPWALIAGWVVGVILLAVLWALARR